jgi:phage baseplate assembly protein W
MPTYIGYSSLDENSPRSVGRVNVDGTIGNLLTKPRVPKKFRMTDEQLVVRDLINALNIKQGDKVGQPTYGTTIWSYIFEPNTDDVRVQIEEELRRLIAGDPRLILNVISVFQYNNGVQFEIEIAVAPFNNATQLKLDLNRGTGRAALV